VEEQGKKLTPFIRRGRAFRKEFRDKYVKE